MPIIAKVLSQHAEEVAFNWQVRAMDVHAPHYLLWELSRHDNRLDAHLDGLVVAGEHGWEFALDQLEAHPEPGETFAISYLAFKSGNQAKIARALKAAAITPANAKGTASAIGWMNDLNKANDYVLQLGFGTDATSRRIGMAIAGIYRLPPGPVLQAGLRDAEPAVAARAAKAVGEVGASGLLGPVRALLSHRDLEARFWSSWTLALVGNDPGAITELRTIAMTERRYRRRAVEMACRRGDPRTTHKWLQGLEMLPGGLRFAINGYAALGDPVIVPRLLEWMRVPGVARVASEAFANICGVHISYDNLEGAPPAGFEAGPTESPADDDVSLDPDMNLYWPDVAKCADWWAKNQKNFAIGQRYLCGKPITIESAREILKSGYQRQRAAAAFELAIKEPGKPLYEVRAPGFRQK